jgi:hypothetical protein
MDTLSSFRWWLGKGDASISRQATIAIDKRVARSTAGFLTSDWSPLTSSPSGLAQVSDVGWLSECRSWLSNKIENKA